MMSNTKKLVLAGVLVAIGLLLPSVFHFVVPSLARTLSPLHLPAFFAGFLLGGPWGLAVGLITPLLSSLLTGMPPLFPMGVSMMVEIGLYGLISGLLIKEYKIKNIIVVLLLAILVGRLGFTITMNSINGIINPVAWSIGLYTNIVAGIPAIILQCILIPLLIPRLKKVL